MNRANAPWRPVKTAAVHWSDAGEPISSEFGDVYYSSNNGLAESRHVFLAGNRLPQRWQSHQREHFCIGETGFGTALNFLVTWQAWREMPEPRPQLHYISVENAPLTQQDLKRALSLWPELAALSAQLLGVYPGPLPGQHRLLLDDGRVRLDLWWEEASEALADLAAREQPLIDAWYLDGFAPARNQALWSAQLLRTIAVLCHDGATFATFTAAGQVRRDLTGAGFDVLKVPGHGRKRESLCGTLRTMPALVPGRGGPRWDLTQASQRCPRSVLVIGGGLAGCSVADALARRNIAVTLLEQHTLASAGSGFDQGILFTRLSRLHSPLVDFALQSFQFATGFYRQLFVQKRLASGVDGELCGFLQLCDDSNELLELAQSLAHLPELARVLESEDAAKVLGIAAASGGYWFPNAGWLHPAAVCRALTNHENIQVVDDCGELAVTADDGLWHAVAGGRTIASADSAVIATGTGTGLIEQVNWLPLQSIRGQTTQLPCSPLSAMLHGALCHEGYIAPARAGAHCIGATFDLKNTDTAVCVSDHRTNLSKLGAAIPAWGNALEQLDPATLTGRVGFRCTSPDYLPLVGRVPDRETFLERFADLRKDARRCDTLSGEYLRGLYLTAAHGSRGLTSTPLAAELLASIMCSEPLPLNRELCRALNPARFIIRDLSRNRI